MPRLPFPACPSNRDPTWSVDRLGATLFIHDHPLSITSDTFKRMSKIINSLCIPVFFGVFTQLTHMLEAVSNNMATACRCGAWPQKTSLTCLSTNCATYERVVQCELVECEDGNQGRLLAKVNAALFSIIILLTLLSVSTRIPSSTQGATPCTGTTVPYIMPLLRPAFLQPAS